MSSLERSDLITHGPLTTGLSTTIGDREHLAEQLAFTRQHRANQQYDPNIHPVSFTDSAAITQNDRPNGGAGNNPVRTRAEISSLILGPAEGENLGSNSFQAREGATQLLLQTGLRAVPQLLLAAIGRHPDTGQPLASTDAEVMTRSGRLITNILDNRVDANQLLSLRNQQTRNQFLEQSLGRQPTAAESGQFLGAIDAAMARRLEPGALQHALTELSPLLPNGDFIRKLVDGLGQQVSEGSLAMADRLATPQGQAQLWSEIDRLRVINTSQNATAQERSNAAAQIRLLTTGVSPEQVQNMRVFGRVAQAESLIQNPFPGSQQTAHNHMLEAYRLATAPAGTAVQREQILASIGSLDLDQNATFMTAFVNAGGNRQAAEQAGQNARNRAAQWNGILQGIIRPGQMQQPIVPQAPPVPAGPPGG